MTPKGFTFAGVSAGLKGGNALDLGLLVSDRPAVASGVVTTNRFQAAPIVVSKRNLKDGAARAIVVNAKNANACTGKQGLADAKTMTRVASRALALKPQDILVASTGVIGRPMPMKEIKRGIKNATAALSSDPTPLSLAMMTTDTKPKTATATAGSSTIVGLAKGAGMIAPELATMLCFIATDAAISKQDLDKALQTASHASFDTISVDGCMSTNDCIFVLANGASGPADQASFQHALNEVCESLARQIVEDAEGATKVVSITVRSARTQEEAAACARRIADSVLLRCAIGGADPNWGRVLAALGTTKIKLNPNLVDVWLGGEKLAEAGAIGPGDLEKASIAMREREVEVIVALNRGSEEATILTNDLTKEYVAINGEYTS